MPEYTESVILYIDSAAGVGILRVLLACMQVYDL